MSINVRYSYIKKNLFIEVSHDDLKELLLIEEAYFKILNFLFVNKQIIIITLQPQVYSFANGLGECKYFSIESKKILVTKISNVSDAFLKSISNEEEFKRGLLIIAEVEIGFSEFNLKKAFETIKNGESELPSEIKFVVCEDDGNTICLYNFNKNYKEITRIFDSTLFPRW